MKRLLAALLLAAMLLGTAACGSGDTAETTAPVQTAAESTEQSETTGPTETNRENAKSTLPAGLDLKGMTVKFGYVDANRYRDDIIGDIEGNVVREAVYYRNLNTEEKLNIKLEPVIVATGTGDAATKIQSYVVAGDHVVDINDGHQAYLAKFVLDGYFANMNDDKYIAYDEPWWKTEYIDELAVGTGKRFFLFGDMTLMMFKSAGATYVNKKILEDQFMKLDELYDLVLEGKWTMDKFYEMTSQAYVDKNGNGQSDAGDQIGFMATTVKSVEHFQYDSGIRTTTRDKNGIPQLTLNNERTVLWAEKFYKLYYENPGARIWTADSNLDNEMMQTFKNGQCLFYPQWFYLGEYFLGDMEDDYGIIPYPKLDESVERYTTLVHDGTTTIVVPVTIPQDRMDVIGAVLEEMAFESYTTVFPAYYEVTLKLKYARDSTSTKMIDLIWDAAFTDFGYAYSSNLGGLGMLRQLAKDKTPDFASYYASKESAKAAMQNLIALYLEKTK